MRARPACWASAEPWFFHTKEGILRFRHEGFETFERRVRFADGGVELDVKLVGSGKARTTALQR